MKIKVILMMIISMILFLGLGCIGKENGGEKDNKENQTIQDIEDVRDASDADTPRIFTAPKGWQDPNPLIELAKKDVITRFDLSESDINVDGVIPVEWTDTSLGYPEPGKEIGKDYQLDTIRGYVILISENANKKLYEYHSDYYKIVPPTGPIQEDNLEDMPGIIYDNKNKNISDNQ